MKFFLISALLLSPFISRSQALFDPDTVSPGEFDYGKMWTFDDPPLEYLAETYNFDPDAEWMTSVQLSTLRLSSGCSASFISENGLILTNHHCAREAAVLNTTIEEDVLEKGFVASQQGGERKLAGFYADQLQRIADVTQEMKDLLSTGTSFQEASNSLKNKYQNQPEWKGLTLQVLTFYSGGKYSLYGFKRYTDIRLVLIPEQQLGYFGGDPDNFTYPRYALDCSFLRAYDAQGNPVNSGSNFFKFNPEGIKKNEPVFVVGNPGSTGRYRTMAQLEYDRDRRIPIALDFFRSRMNILKEHNEVLDSDSITAVILRLSNAEKSYGGRLDGLHNEYFMTRKTKLEERNKEMVLSSEGADYWDQIAQNSVTLGAIAAEERSLNPYFNWPVNGRIIQILYVLDDYREGLSQDKKSRKKLQEETRERLNALRKGIVPGLEKDIYAQILTELKKYSQDQSDYISKFLAGKTPQQKSEEVFRNSILINSEAVYALPDSEELFNASLQPLVVASRTLIPHYKMAKATASSLNNDNKDLEQKIINAQFTLSEVKSPPDATFSLRISDGVVRGYKYNGTLAPFQTTYFGMYDRYYSNNKMFPWSLPERWTNPTFDLLASPLNFVATFDTIGGNSGSPVINRNRELVGLNFDSNFDRLPVRSIMYDPAYGRSVGVHAGGIAAALKYIYKDQNLIQEIGLD